jgi:bis(5'-nucleosyl)-tetraphosphatase (symmetrical)
MNSWAIGDVQGCHRELVSLLEKIAFEPDRDELWLVGDLINRGPDNVAVMDLVMSLPRTVCVLGNHDLHFLAIAMDQQTTKRGDTINDLLKSERLPDYISYLRQLPLLHHDMKRNLVMVHAGLPPQLDIDRCRKLAAEVEAVLKSDKCSDFLAAMYGNEPDTWQENLTGMNRLRLITNYFTRLRFCTSEGRLELTHKTDLAPSGFDPWFTFERSGDEQVVFGHWAALEGKADADFVTSLDTGCVWGRELTAMNLDTRERVSVPSLT